MEGEPPVNDAARAVLASTAANTEPENRKLPKAEHDALTAAVPLPPYGTHEYRMHGGRPWLFRASAPDANGAVRWTRLHTPAGIVAGVRFGDHGGARGLRLVLNDEGGEVVTVDLPAGLAFRNRGTDLRVMLRELGVGMTGDGAFALIDSVGETQPPNPITIYDRPGWRDGVFLTPWGRAIGAGNKAVELAAGSRPPGAETVGTLEAWREAASAAFEADAEKAWLLQVGILAAFASPIIDLCQLPTVWLAFTGSSGRGKTTAKRLQASAWGDTREKKGLLNTFSNTVKAVEVVLQNASGAGCGLDEAKLISGSDLHTLVFTASTGSGRGRLSRSAALQASGSWSLLVTMSNERTIAEKIKAEGGTLTTGLGARLLDLNVDGLEPLDRPTMDRIEPAFANHGHAGPEFVRHLFYQGYDREPERLAGEVEERARTLAGDGPPVALRAARIVALLWTAGELARDAGLIPADADVKALAERLWAVAKEAETAPGSAPEQAVRTLYEALVANRGGTVQEGLGGGNRAAQAWRLDPPASAEPVYIVRREALADLAGGAMNARAVAAELRRRGDLLPFRRADGRETFAWEYVRGLGKVAVVVIRAGAVEDEAPEDESD